MLGKPGHRDPRSYVVIQPLPIAGQKGMKIKARSDTVYNCWEPTRDQVFWANYQRRQKQLTVGYRSPICNPYQVLGEPLYLEAKKLILHSLGQEEQADAKDEELFISEEVPEVVDQDTAMKESQDKMKPILKPSLFHRPRGKDRSNLNKELLHTRQLVSVARQGRGYFDQLRKEKEEKVVAKQVGRQRKVSIQPAKLSSDEEQEEEEEVEDEQQSHAGWQTHKFFTTEVQERKKSKKEICRPSRPFTPVHHSLLSENLFDADPEPLFRQLCALHWLLEALYIEPFSAMRPVSTCWSVREPGGTKSTLKRISKEKEVEANWDRFTMQGKVKKPAQRATRGQFHRSRRFSFMSSARHSALSSSRTPTLGSVSSLVPSSEEVIPAASVSSEVLREVDDESVANGSSHQGKQAKEEEESPMSEYLKSLLEEIRESVRNEMSEEENQRKSILLRAPSLSVIQEKTWAPEYEEQESTKGPKQRPKSSPSINISPTSKFVNEKVSMSSQMREKFLEIAEEGDLCLRNNVDVIERRREEFSTQKFRSLDNITFFHQDMEKLRKPFRHVKEETDYANTENWYFSLLARIPHSLRSNPKIQRILSKLEKLEEKQYAKIRPNAFLRVLNGLRQWELCSPDVCVAVEFVRERLVQMSPEEYVTWLQTRVATSCQRAQSAPPMR